MRKEQTQQSVNDLEAALIEYVEKYGLTKKAKLALTQMGTPNRYYSSDHGRNMRPLASD